MAFNAYLLFHKDVRGGSIGTGIFGESTSQPQSNCPKPFNGAIEIQDYAFGVTMPVSASRSDGGGATVGRANFDIFSCTKGIDSATPFLVQYCCTGKNIPSIVLHLYRQGGEDIKGTPSAVVKYAMVVFQNCVITKVGVSGSGEELPKESLEFNYGLCEYVYQQTQKTSGTTKGMAKPFGSNGWSTVTNSVVPSKWDFSAWDPPEPAEKDM
jgi:type VI secretion system secreted protein Hcp